MARAAMDIHLAIDQLVGLFPLIALALTGWGAFCLIGSDTPDPGDSRRGGGPPGPGPPDLRVGY